MLEKNVGRKEVDKERMEIDVFLMVFLLVVTYCSQSFIGPEKQNI
jgi:hypothetical protein